MDGDAFLVGLTATQREAVTSTAAPLCVLAGAGSGKTRVLTRRIAYRVATSTADPARVLALTFTRKAAGELRSRLSNLSVRTPVAAGTFHGVAFAQLRQWFADRGRPQPVVLDRKARVLGPLVAPGSAPRSGAGIVAGVGAEIEWAKARIIGPDDYARAATETDRLPAVPIDRVAELYARYETDMRRRGLLDFDDLLLRCAEAIGNDTGLAAAQRWRFQHLFVDEYQDLNPAQERLLSAWIGQSTDLCVVGDPHQSIYGWNGSDPSLLTDFTSRYPTAGVIELVDNFRSSPEIMAVARAALPGVVSAPTIAPSGPVPSLRAYETDTDEAAGIARKIRELHAPTTSWSRIAVLARTNAQLEVIARALAAAEVPHCVRGGRRLPRHAAVEDVLAVSPKRQATALAGDFELALSALDAPGESDDALRTGLAALREYLDVDPGGTVAGFTTWLETSERNHDGPAGQAVVLSSFHRAKGLEWPVVFVAGLENGLVPLSHSAGAPPVAEERRLLYVALTRAQAELHCSLARRRQFGERLVERAPSPFLPPLVDAIAALTTNRRPVDPRPALRDIHLALADDQSEQANLLGELRAWRVGVARGSRVAPAAIVDDRTLAAVAAQRPRNRLELEALATVGPVGRHGPGPLTTARWADAMLAVVARHSET